MANHKNRGNKAQHFIPKSYLAAWADPDTPANFEPYVHRFTRAGERLRPAAPAKIFTANDLYTLKGPDGSRDLRFEAGLAGLEQGFARIRRRLLAPRKPLQNADWQQIFAFTAAMHNRTPQQIEHTRAQYARVVKVARDAEKHIRTHVPSKIGPSLQGDGPTYTIEEFEAAVADPVGNLTGPMIEAEFRALVSTYNGVILCTEDPVGFVTSDSPVSWFVPNIHRLPPVHRIAGLGRPNMQISMPLSPTQCLFLAQRQFESTYVSVARATLDMFNHRTVLRAHEVVVSSRPFISEEWCKPVTLPADAWEFTEEGKAALKRREARRNA